MVSDKISSASVEELKRGFIETGDAYECLCCGYVVEKGLVYPEGDLFYEAFRFIRVHLEREHGSMFHYLISLDKSVTGLSDVQRSLLALFHEGKSDAEIQKRLGIGSTSTIRNHRFNLREKERQARMFLAVMELLQSEERTSSPAAAAPRRAYTPAAAGAGEEEKVLRRYFAHGIEGPLKSFPVKDKLKRMVLAVLAGRFEYGRRYSEMEVNDILEEAYAEDYVLLRRGLVDYGYMDREADGSEYWLLAPVQEGERGMSRREELKQLAKEIKTVAGVFQVKNTRNGKVWIDSSRNFKNMNGIKFQLEMGGHRNKALQQEWNEFGGDAFSFDVLEVLEKKETGYFDEKDELKKLKDKWLKELEPYGERGYNDPREADS